MINKIKRWKLDFRKLVVPLDLLYFILLYTVSVSETFMYVSAFILAILNSVFLFTKMKKVGLLKSLAFLLLINIPIWVFVILLTYSKYQSLLFQTIAFAFVFVSFTTIVTFILLVVNRIIQAGKLKLTLAVIMLFVALCFTVSILAYQRLVNEGSMIADKQCLKVNPLIIQRKNSYVKSMEIILAKGSEIDYMNELNKYMDISNKYVEEQKKWLQEEKAFMNRIDYKLFLPSQVQTANQLQFDSREAEMK